MSTEPENLVLEILRRVQGDLGELRAESARQGRRLDELSNRVAHVDAVLAGIKSDIGNLHVIATLHSNAFDQVRQRLDKIEKHLGLVDA
jgi:tetrahydromethanopterin S-methyltransferase subunit G